MNIKIVRIFGILCLAFAFPSYAAPYTPLVQIPGLGNEVTISSYLIGMYNFLLSIVGIVAVLMLILGGMRYISAAGNSSAIGDAKSMIESAIFGLLLALLSWLFVSTINPDILYLSNPDMPKPEIGLFQCGTYDSTSKVCTCPDNTVLNSLNDSDECQVTCAASGHCSESGFFGSCIQPFSSNEATKNFYGPCTCITGNTVNWTEGAKCDDLCEGAGECGHGRFLVVKLRLRNAMTAGSDEYLISSASTTESISDGKWTGHDPDAIWDFFLTDNGNYGPFAIPDSETHKRGDGLESFDCGILTLNEDSEIVEGLIGGAAFDEGRIYWVKEGTVISRSNNNLLKSIDQDGNYTSCCTTTNIDATDCLMEAWGECEAENTDKVIRAVFSWDILDNKANQTDLAELNEGGGVGYILNRPLICSDGKWR
jgi:hypothetical protein